jgi:hypothetical protein
MKNRYGKEYSFERVDDNTYKFIMAEEDAMYMRVGGREGQDQIDMNDLGYFDPSGGPFISIDSIIEYKRVSRIRSTEEGIFVDVEG